MQAPVAVQEHQGRQTISAADLSGLRELDAAIDGRLRAGDLRAYETRTNDFLPGRQSERLAQYYQGIPVYGADLNRQTDGGVTTSVFGTQFTGIDLDTSPGLSGVAARAVLDELGGPVFGPTGDPELWVLPTDDVGYALTWRGTLSDMRTVFIDADTGEVLFEFGNWRTQTVGLGTGVLGDRKKMSTQPLGGAFVTRDLARPAEIRTLDMESDPNRFVERFQGVIFGTAPATDQDLSVDADNTWDAGRVVDVHAAMGWTYDYFFTNHGWAGLGNNDRPIDAFVRLYDAPAMIAAGQRCLATDPTLSTPECIIVANLLLLLDNAAYFFPTGPETNGALVFGEPDFFPEPLTTLDIVGHEMSHGVNFHSARLGNTTPPNAPGAIDEGLADIFGTAVEFYAQEAGDGPLRADYLIGEDSGIPVRSLRDPQEIPQPFSASGTYPDHFSNLFRGPEDFGGFHINATILGHLYYLAIEGGTNRTSGLTVQ
ncbi:MAG: M4 family metallopeptidase, partial [Vicinamibacterales bacterium]|nr:M4 family metallopeptidase [Vicinamibacterales bacterium]